MAKFNYSIIVFALIMMNVMNAELKTWGVPKDIETEEAPNEEAPNEEVPNEEAPNEEAPNEEVPNEEAPIEDEEVPSASEDNEINTDQPIKFKEEFLFSMNLGSTSAIGANLKDNFDGGMGFSIGVLTPFGFSLGDRTLSFSANLSMVTLPSTNTLWSDYSMTKIGGSLSTDISLFTVSLGTGLSIGSGQMINNPYDDYSATTFYLAGGLGLNLPVSTLLDKLNNDSLSSLKMSINVNGAMVFGSPEESGTSDLLNFGMTIGYPILL